MIVSLFERMGLSKPSSAPMGELEYEEKAWLTLQFIERSLDTHNEIPLTIQTALRYLCAPLKSLSPNRIGTAKLPPSGSEREDLLVLLKYLADFLSSITGFRRDEGEEAEIPEENDILYAVTHARVIIRAYLQIEGPADMSLDEIKSRADKASRKRQNGTKK